MQINTWLSAAQETLRSADIATARLDCLVLLEDETGKDRAWLLSHPEHELQKLFLENLNTKITRRIQHTPLAYIRGHTEFYGREFAVNEQVLIPRPETEAMIELVKSLGMQPGTCVLDIGTGSGCIAITAALELPDAFVQACDIDPACIEIAERNADVLGANVHFYESNLLQSVDACDILLCNLPYVPHDYAVNDAAKHEPELALFAGKDGLDLYRQLFEQIKDKNWKPNYVLTESLPEQHTALATLAEAASFSLEKTDSFIQVFKQPV